MSLPIGSRVRVTGEHVPHLKGGRYDGATATVVGHNLTGGLNLLKFDPEFDVSNAGTWSDRALEIVVDPPKVGDRVKIVSGEYLQLPIEGTLRSTDETLALSKKVHPFLVEVPRDTPHASSRRDSNGTYYVVWASEVETIPNETQEVTTMSERPTIDFSTDSRRTARTYAADLVSRVNKPETNTVLKQVAKGEQVDAYALAEALLDAQRHVATRFGQSMQRRREGEKAAHLGYIAHAVLANHADGLPVYADSGVRSRKIEELEAEVADLRASVTRANETLAETAADLESEKVKHASTIENLVKTDQAWRDAVEDRQTLRKIHAYAFGLLSDQDQSMVKGFEDGLNA